MDLNRKTAYLILVDIEDNMAYSNIAINEHVKREAPDSPAFVRELVYGVLENKYYLDYIVSRLVDKVSKIKTKEKTLLRMGLYQLIYMNSVPTYAAVNETVNLAKRYCRGKDGFINGVLRRFGREKDHITLPDQEQDVVKYLSIKYSYEPWIVDFWIKEFGVERTELLLAAGNRKPDLIIRANVLKTTRAELVERLADDGNRCEASELVKEALIVQGSGVLDSPLYEKGFFSVQDVSSMLAVCALDPKPEQRMIDVCAAPGGKTGFMAERMGNKGCIIAGDFYEKKLNLIDRQMKRTGISIVQTKQWDGAELQTDLLEWADGVLVDAPCSGLGVIRRKPEIKYKKQGNMIAELAQKQLEILTNAAAYVKSGGTLVYSTCTISRLENQLVIEKFLKDHNMFKKVGERQLFPDQDHTDGFYICKMIRD